MMTLWDEIKSLCTAWYSLQPKNKKSKNKEDKIDVVIFQEPKMFQTLPKMKWDGFNNFTETTYTIVVLVLWVKLDW